MGVTFTDRKGPRLKQEFIDARQAVAKSLVTFDAPASLLIHAPTIMDALKIVIAILEHEEQKEPTP